MTATKDIDTLISSQDLPMELARVISASHQGDEPRIATMLSGMFVTRQQDEVICPLMLRRNLLVPAHQGAISQSAWHVE